MEEIDLVTSTPGKLDTVCTDTDHAFIQSQGTQWGQLYNPMNALLKKDITA